ncbi:MAG: hypothetical protein K8Q91_01060 [Candidatus Vogelbacteria bacterium]|nr:hypothetical protein [Candidatus Vogelbacteria bacterium]
MDGAKDVGVLQFLGYRIGSIDAGIVPGFWGLTTVNRYPRAIITREVPANPEDLWRGKDDQGNPQPLPSEPKGMKKDASGKMVPDYWIEPIFVPFESADPADEEDILSQTVTITPTLGDPATEEKYNFVPAVVVKPDKGQVKDEIADQYKDPLKTRVIAEVSASYTMQITKGLRFDIAFDSIEDATNYVRDLIESGMRSVCQVGTAARAQRNVDAISRYVTRYVLEALAENRIDYKEVTTTTRPDIKRLSVNALRKLIEDEIGLRFTQVKNFKVLTSHSLNAEIQKIAESIGKGVETQRAGEALANNHLRMMTAEAAGLKKIQTATGVSGQEALVIDAAKAGLSNPNAVHIIGDGGISGIATQIAQTLKKVSETKPETQPTTPPATQKPARKKKGSTS